MRKKECERVKVGGKKASESRKGRRGRERGKGEGNEDVKEER